MMKRNVPGNVALTSVLVFSALLIASGVTILIQAIDFTSSALNYGNQINAENRAVTCLEEALLQLTRDISTTIVTVDYEENGSCTATVSGSVEYKEIQIESTYRDAKYSTLQAWDFSQAPDPPVRTDLI